MDLIPIASLMHHVIEKTSSHHTFFHYNCVVHGYIIVFYLHDEC